jgi:hypothetical protein
MVFVVEVDHPAEHFGVVVQVQGFGVLANQPIVAGGEGDIGPYANEPDGQSALTFGGNCFPRQHHKPNHTKQFFRGLRTPSMRINIVRSKHLDCDYKTARHAGSGQSVRG